MRGAWDVSSVLALAELHRRLRPDVVHWHARARTRSAPWRLRRAGTGARPFATRRFPGARIGGEPAPLRPPPRSDDRDLRGVRDALVESGLDSARIRVSERNRPRTLRGAVRPRRDQGEARDPGRGLPGTPGGGARAAQVAEGPASGGSIVLDQHPEAMVWIAGENPARRAGTAGRGAEPGDRVRLLGFRDDVPDLLRAADLFCVSSYLEGMGTATLDAMAAGLPVVATRVGGIPEIVEDG